jgi:hypothetical protein
LTVDNGVLDGENAYALEAAVIDIDVDGCEDGP